jgi:steroid delta-isomerase-like uncharacterized protein
MEISSPERALDEWAAAWTAGDLERVAALFTDDCVYEDVAMGTINRGREELRTLQGGAVLAGTPHVQIMLTSRFVAGQCGAMEWILSGSREVEISGLPLQGKEFIVRGASVVQFRDAQIVRCSDYWDFAAFARNFCLK